MSGIKTLMFIMLTGASLILTGCVNGSLALNSDQYKMMERSANRYQQRPGWGAFKALALNDCKTSKNGGDSLIKWSGKDCSVQPLIDYFNENPNLIPLFYAAYHEYGTTGVRAIDIYDASKVNYLTFIHDLTLKVSKVDNISKIYDDYKKDQKLMGLDRVSESSFTDTLLNFSKSSDKIKNQIYQSALDSNAASIPTSGVGEGRTLGVSYRAMCGTFGIDLSSSDGWTRINGEKVTSQKITFLKQKDDWDNVKTDMALMPARDGNMYGFQFIKRDGKSFLNVQLLQNNMDAPKIIGSFPCKKVS